MTLIYNHATNRYEGEATAVSVAAMNARVERLVASGMAVRTVLGLLLDEAEWTPSMVGVERLPRLCLQCR